MRHDDKELAKQIILEIILQAGGVLRSKTRLFKAFYHAHAKFAQTQPGYLSAWPIVRMPFGPGIDKFDTLLGELMTEEKIETEEIEVYGKEGIEFRLTSTNLKLDLLPEGAGDAIAYGVNQIKSKSAKQVSDESHVMSRAWRESSSGQELNIYLDSLDDDEYQEYIQGAQNIRRVIDSASN
jgi:hypothetical protein